MKDYKKALQLGPNRLANCIGMGRTYAAMGKSGDAKENLGHGLAMPDKERVILL